MDSDRRAAAEYGVIRIRVMNRLRELPLHDALLHQINIDWKNHITKFDVSAFIHNGKNAEPCTLTFSGVSNVSVPHNNAWGESLFINEVNVIDDAVEIHMQSGDIIKISAVSFTFETNTTYNRVAGGF